MIRKAYNSGFTLIEMLVVMALMALLIGVGVSSFYGMGQGSSLIGGENEVQAALALARQQTIMQNASVNIYFYQDDSTDDIVYEMWAMTNGVNIAYGPKTDSTTLTYEIGDAINEDRDNKYGYKLGVRYHFAKGIDVTVDGTTIEDAKNEYITLRPTGAAILPDNSVIELVLPEKGYGRKITIFSVTGLTKVEDI
ncbi:MAG: prepilin-type N-terminal cleavage/methylation domain-containing protein [Kiritimatiellae bacterium]|jgi:prepilin-type N-terminal cleavage/methylation domain-containing protein|nr:prepilin-type N-terminal cleavage/methylation domain-containing protein [Kiritimatiellia bacterium]